MPRLKPENRVWLTPEMLERIDRYCDENGGLTRARVYRLAGVNGASMRVATNRLYYYGEAGIHRETWAKIERQLAHPASWRGFVRAYMIAREDCAA